MKMSKKSIGQRCIKNWQYKLIAIALAFALWFYVTDALPGSTSTGGTDFMVTVDYANLDADLEVAVGKVQVKVTIYGNDAVGENLGAKVDCSGLKAGTHTGTVEVATQPDQKVLSVDPGVVTFTLKEK